MTLRAVAKYSAAHCLQLEALGYSAEHYFKSMLGQLVTESSLSQTSIKWVPFSNQGSIKAKKEREGLHFSYSVSKIW